MEGGCWQSARGSSQTVMGRAGALTAAPHQPTHGCGCFAFCTPPRALPCWMYVLPISNAFTQGGFSLCGQHIIHWEELGVPPPATGCSAQSTTSSEETDTDTHVCLQMRETRDKTVVQTMMAVCCSMLHRTTHSQTLCHGCDSLFLW